MPYRVNPFINQSFYHIYNRGVEKRQIFVNNIDYQRFWQTLYYYQFSGPKPRFSTHHFFKSLNYSNNPKIVEIICYCFMPNHYHFLVRQLREGGIQEFIAKISNSYTKYFNTKNKRVGPLFQGTFKAVSIENDEQLIHVSRYIHLNPVVANLVKKAELFPYSSFSHYLGSNNLLINSAPVMELFKDAEDYTRFIEDHQDYAMELERIKHLLLEE